MIRARTLEELIDAAALFAGQPLPAGRRVAVITNAGGLGILCADACDAAGLELPALTAETEAALRAVLPKRRASRTRSTCSACKRGTTYEEVLPMVQADPAWTP